MKKASFLFIFSMLCLGCEITKAPECLDGALFCQNTLSGGVMKICEDGKWKEHEQCTNIYNDKILVSCADDHSCSQCDSDICLVSDKDRMSYTYKCVEHQYSDDYRKMCDLKCADNGLICSDEQCAEGDALCITENDEINYMECHGGRFIKVYCPFCTDSNTCGECKPYESSCKNYRQAGDGGKTIGLYKSCGENGMYDDGKLCYGACTNETSCDLQGCADGDMVCQNDSDQVGYIKTCSGGTWPNTDSCTEEEGVCTKCPNGNSCLNTLDSCGECKNGEYKCEDGVIYYCKDGLFDKSKKAVCDKELGVCALGNECLSCQTETMACTNKDSGDPYGVLTVQCDSGEKQWQCDNSCNAKGDDCGACLNSMPAYCQDDEYGLGRIKSCVNGELQYTGCEGMSCDASQNNKCGTCLNGSFTCKNDASGRGTLRVCIGGSEKYGNYYYDYQCASKVGCTEDGCDDSPSSMCKSVYNNSIANVIQIKDKKANVTSCSLGACNSDKTDCGECNGGPAESNTTCQNNADGVGVMNGCYYGKSMSNKLCKDADDHEVSCGIWPGRPFGYCGECLDGDIKCDNSSGTGKITVCIDGYWKNPYNSLTNTFSCHDGIKCDQNGCLDKPETMCAELARLTVNNAELTGYEITIENGRVKTMKVCDKPLTCFGDKCGECDSSVPNACKGVYTNAAVLRRCVGNVFEEVSCNSNCYSSTSCCDDSKPPSCRGVAQNTVLVSGCVNGVNVTDEIVCHGDCSSGYTCD